eukprot:5029167-Lingulodinium_polyedra.AAC.1
MQPACPTRPTHAIAIARDAARTPDPPDPRNRNRARCTQTNDARTLSIARAALFFSLSSFFFRFSSAISSGVFSGTCVGPASAASRLLERSPASLLGAASLRAVSLRARCR